MPGHDVERFSAEIGYWLGEALWGRGIVTEAVILLTGYAFRELNVPSPVRAAVRRQPGSIRVLEKAGYVREGLLRSSSVKYGQTKDQLIYARINPDWRLPTGG